jgi:hypothetical protein
VLVNENHLDWIYQTKKATLSKELTRQKGHQLSPKKGETRCLLLTETSGLIVKSSAYLYDLICFLIA